MATTHAADFLNLANFVYPNNLPMPQITKKNIL